MTPDPTTREGQVQDDETTSSDILSVSAPNRGFLSETEQPPLDVADLAVPHNDPLGLPSEDGSVISGVESMAGIMTTDGSFFDQSKTDTAPQRSYQPDNKKDFRKQVKEENKKVLEEYGMLPESITAVAKGESHQSSLTSGSSDRHGIVGGAVSLGAGVVSEAGQKPNTPPRSPRKAISSESKGPPPAASAGARLPKDSPSRIKIVAKSPSRIKTQSHPEVYDLSKDGVKPITKVTKSPAAVSRFSKQPPPYILIGNKKPVAAAPPVADEEIAGKAVAIEPPRPWYARRTNMIIILLSLILLIAVSVVCALLLASNDSEDRSVPATSSFGGEDAIFFYNPTASPTSENGLPSGPGNPSETASPTATASEPSEPTVPATIPPTPLSSPLPSAAPSRVPTKSPTGSPVRVPTRSPTQSPSQPPSREPTESPVDQPTSLPSTITDEAPTAIPVLATTSPSAPPVEVPTAFPITITPEPTATITSLPTDGSAMTRNTILAAAPPAVRDEIATDGSPAARAADFVARTSDGMDSTRIVQRFAVINLAYSTGRARRWLRNRRLQSGSLEGNECDWSGVLCSNGRVTEINIPNQRLRGTIPKSLSMLENLVKLDLSRNDFSGSIPAELGRLDQIEEIRLQFNDLVGNFAPELNGMKSLREWYLEHNDLSGPFPNDVVLSLPNLFEFSVYHNDLTGQVADEFCARGLSVFWIDCRELSSRCWTRCFFQCGRNGVPCTSN